MQLIALLGSDTRSPRDQRPLATIDVGGISLAERLLRSAKIAGLDGALVISDRPDFWSEMAARDFVLRQDSGFEVQCVESAASLAQSLTALMERVEDLDEEFVVCCGDRVVDPKVLSSLMARSMATIRGVALCDEAGEVIAARLKRSLIIEFGAEIEPPGLDEFIDEARARELVRVETIARPELMRVDSISRGREARARLLRTLRKPLGRQSDGVTAYLINRPVSLSISRLLIHTPVRPNHVTTFDIGLGLVAGFFLASGQPLKMAFGALLMQLVSIFDGIDGELARMKLLMSSTGELYDSVGDDVIKLTMFTSLGWSCYQLGGHEAYWWTTVAGFVFTIAMIAVLYVELYRSGTGTLNNVKWWFEEEGRAPTLWQHFLIGFSFVLKRDTYTFLLAVMIMLGAYNFAFGLMFFGITVIFVSTYAQRIVRLVRRNREAPSKSMSRA